MGAHRYTCPTPSHPSPVTASWTNPCGLSPAEQRSGSKQALPWVLGVIPLPQPHPYNSLPSSLCTPCPAWLCAHAAPGTGVLSPAPHIPQQGEDLAPTWLAPSRGHSVLWPVLPPSPSAVSPPWPWQLLSGPSVTQGLPFPVFPGLLRRTLFPAQSWPVEHYLPTAALSGPPPLGAQSDPPRSPSSVGGGMVSRISSS